MARALQNPREKEELLHHSENLALLEKIVRSGNIHHAFLFSGPKGIGKSTSAYVFARMLLSIGVEKKDVNEVDLFGNSEPAGIIDKSVSEKVAKAIHSDIYVLQRKDEDSKNISADEVRDLSKFLSLTPSEAKYRVAIIDAAGDLNITSANALLKNLEEPTKNTVLVIINHNGTTLLPTIRSRCLEIKFSPLSKKDFILLMSDLGHENESLEDIYDACEGSPGTAIEMITSGVYSTLDKFNKIVKAKSPNITEISSLAKEIKDKDSWKIFGNMFLKQYSQKIRSSPDEKNISRFMEISRLITMSEFQNMDIQDTLKKLLSYLK